MVYWLSINFYMALEKREQFEHHCIESCKIFIFKDKKKFDRCHLIKHTLLDGEQNWHESPLIGFVGTVIVCNGVSLIWYNERS